MTFGIRNGYFTVLLFYFGNTLTESFRSLLPTRTCAGRRVFCIFNVGNNNPTKPSNTDNNFCCRFLIGVYIPPPFKREPFVVLVPTFVKCGRCTLYEGISLTNTHYYIESAYFNSFLQYKFHAFFKENYLPDRNAHSN